MNKHLLDPGLILAALIVALLVGVAAHANSSAGVTIDEGSADADDTGRAFRVWPGMGVGAKTLGSSTGALGMEQLSFSMPLLDWVEPDVTVAIGVNGGSYDLTSTEVVNRFSFGLRWFLPLEGMTSHDVDSLVRPMAWTAIHHGHKVTLGNALANPIAATLTSTDAGVGHLTGLEGGVGVLLALPIDGQSYPLMLRAGASWLPTFVSNHPDGSAVDDVLVVVDIAVGLPILFDRT